MTVKHIVLILLAYGCATSKVAGPPEEVEPVVGVDVALEHIGQSYTMGCVEALKQRGEKNIYPWCRDRGIKHQMAVKRVLDGPVEIVEPPEAKSDP